MNSAATARPGRNGPDFRIPVLRPRLPDPKDMLPYLERIHRNSIASNGGPLSRELEARLAELFGPSCGVASCCSATLGLTISLLAQRAESGTLCMVPAWTFAATAHAIVAAGLVPWIVDVDRKTRRLEPAAALDLLERAPGRVGAVIPVSEFGLPVDSEGWDVFQDRTGLAVVLDLAAAFDGTRPARVPSVISLHATKTVTAGEGGFILSTDDDLIEAIRQCANFGFSKSNQATGPGLNAKLSEYAAAVALVSLSDWPDNRRALQAVGQQYRDVLQGIGCVGLPDGWPAEWVSSTFNVRLEADILPAVVRNLESIGVASRSWWGPGLHRQEAFANFERTETPITDDLAAMTLGLPFWIGLPVEAPGAIAQVIANTERAFLSR